MQLMLNLKNSIHLKQNLLFLLQLSEKTGLKYSEVPTTSSSTSLCVSASWRKYNSQSSRLKYVYTHIPTLLNAAEEHRSHMYWSGPSLPLCYSKGGSLQPIFGAQQLRLVLKLQWSFTKNPDCNTVLHIGRTKGFNRFFLFPKCLEKEKMIPIATFTLRSVLSSSGRLLNSVLWKGLPVAEAVTVEFLFTYMNCLESICKLERCLLSSLSCIAFGFWYHSFLNLWAIQGSSFKEEE